VNVALVAGVAGIGEVKRGQPGLPTMPHTNAHMQMALRAHKNE